MAVHVDAVWQSLGTTVNGTPVRSTRVFNDARVIGRVIDMGGSGFRADFVNEVGDMAEVILPDFYSAVMLVAENFWERNKRLH